MTHACPDLEQDAPDDCTHECDTDLEDAFDDWEPEKLDVVQPKQESPL